MKKIYYMMLIGITAMLLFGQSGLYAQITNIEPIDAQCYGSINGKVFLTTTIGTTISGVLVNGLPADSLSNNKKTVFMLPYGNHTISVSFSAPSGLLDSVFSVFIDQPTALSVELSYTYDCANQEIIEICATNNGGNTDFGGVPPYDFYWLNFANIGQDTLLSAYSLPCLDPSSNFLPIDMSTYSGDVELYIYDSADCFLSASKVFTYPLVSGDLVPTQGVCLPLNSGSLEVQNVTGGTTPYTYTWSTGAVTSTPTLGSLNPGSYSVTITDFYDCASLSLDAEIPNPNDLELNSTPEPVSCFGGLDGSITLTVINGTGPYIVTWEKNGAFYDAGPGLLTITNLGVGSYVALLNDLGTQCSTSDTFIVSQPDLLAVVSSNITNVSCATANDGSVTATTTGGVTPYSFGLFTSGGIPVTSNSTGLFTSLFAGDYYIEVIDSNQCTAVTPVFSITEPGVLGFTWASTPVSCYNGTNGTISLTVSGGTFPFSYAWTKNGSVIPGNFNLTNLGAGEYCVTITDANGCTTSGCQTLTNPALFEVLLDSINHVICHGGFDGNIGVTVYGGFSPYTYTWKRNSATATFASIEDIANLQKGIYCLTVMDANGCTASLCVTVVEPPPLTILGQVERITCNGFCDGKVKAIPTGGTPGPLGAITWTYRYRIFTNALGTYSAWQVDSFFYNLCPGYYSLQVEDAHGCLSSYPDFQIWEPLELDVVFNSQTNVSCSGGADGSIDISVVGGSTPYTIAWSNGATTADVSGLPAGIYSVTVIDDSDCATTFSTTITQPDELLVSVTKTDVTCCNAADGSVDLTVAGGTSPYVYSWSNGAFSQDLSNLAPGTYCVTVTDFNGCEATICAPTITEPPCLILQLDPINITCFGANNGEVNTVVDGGTSPYSFLWSNGATTQSISALVAGNYCLTVTDAHGCTISGCAVVAEPPSINITTTSNNVSCCNAADGSIDLTVVGGTGSLSILWSNQATTEDIANLGPGTYCVTVTDANNCTASTCVTIAEPPCLNIQLSPIAITCFGFNNGEISTIIDGGTQAYSFLWSNGATTQNISGLSAGSYCLTVTDAHGCTISGCAVIAEPAELVLTEAHVNISCYGYQNGSIDLTITGGNGQNTIVWELGGTFYSNTEDLTNIGPGTYCVTVTDIKGCSNNLCVTITEPPVFEVVVTSFTNITCYGLNNGSIDATITGGTLPYTILWSNGATTVDLVNIGPGNYCLTVTDANQCMVTVCQPITEPPVFNVVLDVKGNVSCFGLSDGFINVNISGGVQPYTYLWTNGATTEDISALVAGNYCMTATDFNGCQTSICIEITQPALLDVSLVSKVDVDCFGNNNGSIDLSVVGGTLPYSYLWSNSATTQDLVNIGPGNYCVTVTDTKGCIDNICIDILEPADLTLALDGKGDITCFNDNNGFINVTATGGVQPYAYVWERNGVFFSNVEDLTSLAPGTYCLTVTDTHQCIEAMTCVIIAEPNALLATVDSYSNVTCFMAANGTIDVSVTGGTTLYTYLWSNGATTQDLINVGPGSYFLTVTDAHDCMAYANATITEPPLLTVTGSDVDIICFGLDNGAIDITPAGGTPGYSYLWNDGATTQDRISLSPGTYSVTVTDALGCTATESWTITQPTQLQMPNPVINNVTVNGGSNGSIDITVTGGTPPYSYLWSNGATTQDVSGLPAGTYSVIVTDFYGCQITGQWIIEEPPILYITITTTNPPCFNMDNGTIDLSVFGGVPAYTYLWSNGATTQDLGNLAPGTYSVTVTDFNGATATGSETITEPAELILSETNVDILCNGNMTGSVDLTVVGGTMPYAYLWSNGATSQDISQLGIGTYCVTVTDYQNCIKVLCATITQPDLLVATINGKTDVSCYGGNTGSIDLGVIGGVMPYTYLWNNGATTQDLANLAAGNYCVTVTDANGCMAMICQPITQPTIFSIDLVGKADVSCFGIDNGSINITVLGGVQPYTFLWSNGATTEDIANLVAGPYCMTATDFNGCQATICVDITQPAALVVTETHVNVLCHGTGTGSIDLTVSGGTPPYNFLWNTGHVTEDRVNLIAGTYNVTVFDAHGCAEYLSVTITQSPLLSAVVSSFNNVTCFGNNNGNISVTTNGGTSPYTYSWSNGATTKDLTNIGPGNYCLTVMDANQCVVTLCRLITEPPVFGIDQVAKGDVSCFGMNIGFINVTVFGGVQPYSYVWSNGATTEDLSNLVAGTYCLTATDFNGCQSTICETITQPAVLALSETHVNVMCNGNQSGSIDLTVAGGTLNYSYLWNNGATSQDLSGLVAGTYCVTVTDANGCTDNLCVTITQPDMLVLSGVVVNPVCYGDMNGSIVNTVAGGTMPYSYIWSNQATSADLINIGAGTYCVTVTDSNDCVVTACYTLTQPDELGVVVMTVVNVDCYGNANGAIDILAYGGTTNYAYLWSNGATTQAITNLGPGTYTVTVTDAHGCAATNSAVITEPAELLLTGSVTNIVCSGQQSGAIDITVVGGVTPYSILWNDGFTGDDRSGLTAGTYCVTITDMHNCMVTACYQIIEPPLLTLDLDAHNLLCLNGNEGWINLTITGGVAPYDIIWSNGATTQNIDSLVAGTYCVTVTDDFGCVATICGTVEQPLNPLAALYITGENVDCYGANNGWFEVMATGGAAPYQYSLDYGAFTPFMSTPMLYTNLTPGFHLLTIGDSNNCEVLYEIEITEPQPLVLSFNWENNNCYGQTNGWIDMTITGGTLYQYLQTCNCDTMCHNILWSNGATTEDISGLVAGTYTVTVTDCNGCIATGSVVITAPPVLVLTYTKTNLNCNGDASGSIDLTVTGGTPAYSYQWSNGATTQDLSGLSGGFYVVTVTDANGCYAMVSVMITEPSPTVLDFDVTNIMCTGVNDGAIDLLLQDSVCLEYHWSNGATTQDINNLAAGWYWVTVIDCNGCVAIDSACVYAPNNPLGIDYTVHNVLCYGGNTGWIEIDAIGGTMPYVGIKWTGVVPTDCCGLDTVVLDSIQLWANGQTSDVIENLEAGTYYVTLTDAYGCEAYAEIVVTQPLCPVNIANSLVTDVDMGVLGAIDIYVCCGTFPYSYYWEYEGAYFAGTEDLTGLQSGTYSITVTDANGCLAFASFVVNSNNYPGWTNGNIESSHTIYVPTNAVSYLSIGDYIGVFYDSLGTMACGGFVKWQGVSTTIAAWGDDGIDPSEQTGFLDDEVFTWVIWDAGTDTEFAAYPTYDLSATYPSDSTYEVNGISALTSLAIGNVLDVQNIDLSAGWNLISTYIDPFLNDVEDVFAPVLPNLIIVKNGDGQVYWPQWSVNVIGGMVIGEGYKVKMSATQVLVVSGVLLTPELTPISIPVDWSIIGYLRTSPGPIATLLSGIVNKIVIVKDEDGHVYWPSMYNINTIGNMLPGKGYHVKMTSGAVLTYAPNGMMTKSDVSILGPEYFNTPEKTGSNMTIGVPQSAWPTSPSNGDEIAILNNRGEILGASVYTGGAISICLWGDDALTSKTEGIGEGESFTLTLWNKASNSVCALVVDTWAEGSSNYEENAISVVGKFTTSVVESNNFALYQNMPNPFSTSTQIKFSIPQDAHVHIGVYSLLGDLIEELVGTEMSAGEYTVECDGSKLAAGSYLYRIITDNYTASKQMNVIK